MKTVIYTTLLLIANLTLSQSSVLSTGTWYKIGITETGIHKIDRNTLDILGVSRSVNPKEISLFGNAVKGILPQANSEERPEDLLENAILFIGVSDESFDQADYILFYGVGPDKELWTENGFEFEKNIYSDTSYYFLRIGGNIGKRIQSKSSLAEETTVVVNIFDDHITYEEDKRNLISSGQTWLGDVFSTGETQTFAQQIEGLRSDISLTLIGASQSREDAEFNISDGSNQVGILPINSIPSGGNNAYSIKARSGEANFIIPEKEKWNLQVSYEGNASNARGFIDRFYMTFQRDLRLYNSETKFRVFGNLGDVIKYQISNASSATIWNVTDPSNVSEQQHIVSGSTAIFNSQNSNVEEFVVFSGSEFPTPFVFGRIANQNLRGDIDYDGIIITAENFLTEADRLAQFHQDHDGLSVKRVTLRQVYNEFSSGRQDVTAIRDYAKYAYKSGGKLKYLLLFGDGSYDYKNRVTSNTNMVPTYESRESFHPILSYSSDDYFAFFDDDEGEWEESTAGDHTMEIGVGRLPVKSLEEAKIIVDKIIHYCTSPNTLGKWRNEITYLADDGDSTIHARHVEDLSEFVDTTYAKYNISKLLLDAFDKERGASKDISPQTTSALKSRIKNGTFLINFIGHGNEDQWTDESVLNRSIISELTNRKNLPIFVTATCEFGRYDNPIKVSGAEELLLSSKGGGIALLTTSRPVFASTNFILNRAFHKNFFVKADGKHQRLGDIIRVTKNESLKGPVNRNFTLLGDPMMLPAFPKLDIIIHELSNKLDTLSALEKISFTGEIQSNGSRQTSFNGQLVVGVFDIKQNFKTKGQKNFPHTYSVRSNALFRGAATVEAGTFNFTFVVPKNISYQYDRGKMSLYAWDEENNIDAAGSSREFVIGGTDDSALPDKTPPNISIYLNDETFINGGMVGSSSLLIAEVSDRNGITTTRNGVVEGITLELEGEVLNLNDFYTAKKNSYQEGTVVYPIQDLEPGNYSVTLNIWDTHNNASESRVGFVVTSGPTLFVFNHLVYPNPIVDQTTFYFEHDREDEDLVVSLIIYSHKGEIVDIQDILFKNSDRMIEIPWSSNANSGRRLNQGIYYYRLIIRSNLDGATKEIAQKLVIVN